MSNKKINPITVRDLTGAMSTKEIGGRTIRNDKMYFPYHDYTIGVSLRDWNLLNLSAPVIEVL